MGKIVIPPFVLVQETIDKFGYDPNTLKGADSYTKLVVRTCFDCGHVYDQQFATALVAFKGNKKCKYCANTERSRAYSDKHSQWMLDKIQSGEYVPPMLGKNHTQETKDRLSQVNTGVTLERKVGKDKADELKKAASEKFSGSGNPFFGKHHTQETIDFLVINSTRTTKRGKDSNFYGKKYWPDRNLFLYNDIKYRSKWEVKTAQYFDSNNILFKFEPIAFELCDTTYTPDFYLPVENKWIEVKGYWYDDAKEKFSKFTEMYPNIMIEVWDQEKLKVLKII